MHGGYNAWIRTICLGPQYKLESAVLHLPPLKARPAISDKTLSRGVRASRSRRKSFRTARNPKLTPSSGEASGTTTFSNSISMTRLPSKQNLRDDPRAQDATEVTRLPTSHGSRSRRPPGGVMRVRNTMTHQQYLRSDFAHRWSTDPSMLLSAMSTLPDARRNTWMLSETSERCHKLEHLCFRLLICKTAVSDDSCKRQERFGACQQDHRSLNASFLFTNALKRITISVV